MRVTTDEGGAGGGAVGFDPKWLASPPTKTRDHTRARIVLTMIAFVLVYAVIAGRLIMLGFEETEPANYALGAEASISAARPDLVDRNGEILATDIRTASLYAEPRRILDIDEAAEAINSAMPELSVGWLRDRLDGDAGFVWLQREITPRQQDAIHRLGIPGVGFLTENQRFYPGGPVASHIVGHVNVDNQGIAGIEKYIDDLWLGDLQQFGFAAGAGSDLEAVALSIDLRVQHILRDELVTAVDRYQAIAAAGIVIDIHTGEVVAMSSIPDYDPNQPAQALDPDRLNRVTAGVYELGSVFKAITVAMGLDSGLVSINDYFDASVPIYAGGFTIGDYHGQNRPLTVPEVFVYSSNIGAARMAMTVGAESQQEFLNRLGLTTRLDTELPESARPLYPERWGDLTTMTVAFGHGVSTTPLNLAAAAAALMNGGNLIPPTFLPRSEADAAELAVRVVSAETSQMMRYMFRLNGVDGTGRRADVPGYLVGGKTGTAEKIVDGRYSSEVVFNSFLAAFPMDDPQYVVLVIVDEPHALPGEGRTAAYNAGPVVANVVRRSASMLGVQPRFEAFEYALLESYQTATSGR
ncbi:MAG: peptidoglycan D,D-transpeptidase FtsI family protein [Alphaproteobacteria bacterium]